jgi:hypothetical protein
MDQGAFPEGPQGIPPPLAAAVSHYIPGPF